MEVASDEKLGGAWEQGYVCSVTRLEGNTLVYEKATSCKLYERITLVHLLASLRFISLHVHMFLHSCSHEQGYKQYKGFIIAQAPMQFTCRDFWKMVYERECGVVVMLSDLVENGKVQDAVMILTLRCNVNVVT